MLIFVNVFKKAAIICIILTIYIFSNIYKMINHLLISREKFSFRKEIMSKKKYISEYSGVHITTVAIKKQYWNNFLLSNKCQNIVSKCN